MLAHAVDAPARRGRREAQGRIGDVISEAGKDLMGSGGGRIGEGPKGRTLGLLADFGEKNLPDKAGPEGMMDVNA